jgi:hypothetical protein
LDSGSLGTRWRRNPISPALGKGRKEEGMKAVLTRIFRVCTCLLFLFACTTTPSKNDLSTPGEKLSDKMTIAEKELYGRIIRMSMSVREVTMAFWLPEQFFRLVASTNPSANPSELETNLKTLRPYTLILAAAGRIQEGKEVQWYTEPEIRRNIRVKDNRGAPHEPQAQNALSPEAGALVDIFSAGMKLHALREGKSNPPKFHCFAFQKDGKAVVNPNDRGSFSVVLQGFEHRFETPL